MLSLKKINSEQVEVIKVNHPKPQQILGYDVFPSIYCNIFLCARKGSGKTNIINKILTSCIDKNTKVIVFASTHDIDDNWLAIKKNLNTREIQSLFYSQLEENKIDNLEYVMSFMKNENQAEEINNQKEDPNDLIQIIKFDKAKGVTIKLKKEKKVAPKYIIIFDDISTSLNHKNVPFLLKTFRHYKSKVIISSQYFNDVTKDARMQIDYLLLFGGEAQDKMEKDIYPVFGCDVGEENFYDIYKQITKEKHDFLYINKNECDMRKNFDHKITINH